MLISPQFLFSYLQHRLTAKTRHGLHSPFVYNLADKVIYDSRSYAIYKNIEQVRHKLLRDNRLVNITDLGAGSHAGNRSRKRVKQIARHVLKSAALSQLIYRLAHEYQPRSIVELGTSLGLTTAYLAGAVPPGRITSIEGSPEIAHIARETLDKLHVHNVNVITGSFDDILPEIIAKEKTIDLVFIDGNHRKESTLHYFDLCLPAADEHSLMIFDDIYWSAGMKEAWQQIKDHPRVTVTVDLFWMGLVFFRKGQAKEHFKIKFP